MDMLDDSLQTGDGEKVTLDDSVEPHVVMPEAVSVGDGEDTIAGVSQGTLTLDANMQYRFQAETSQGQVTYRVVQVGSDGTAQNEAAMIQPAVAQVGAVTLQNPFANGSPTQEALAYVPTV